MTAPTERYERVGWANRCDGFWGPIYATEWQAEYHVVPGVQETAVELFRRVSVPERPRVQVPGTDVFVEYRDGAFWCPRWSFERATRFEDVDEVITVSGFFFRDEDIRALFDLPEQSRAWDAEYGGGGVSARDRIIDAIYRAVEEAVDGGMAVPQFFDECRGAWDAYLAEKRKTDAKFWVERAS